MDKTRKIHIALSIVITAAFVCIGIFWCTKSYLRLWETLGELCSALKFYFCELFGIEQKLAPNEPVIPPSEVLNGELNLLPTTLNVFLLKLQAYFMLLINGSHLGLYFTNISTWLGDFAKILLMVFPAVIVLVICIKKLYDKPNTKHNHDTLPLRAFKRLGGTMYQPIKKFVLGYSQFLEDNSRWKTLWIWIWLGNLNFLSILVAFFAYYFYFAISFDVASLYPQVVTLLKDLLLVLKFFPWFLTGTIAWLIFKYIRENIGGQILQHHEARNCGFIKELPIVTMECYTVSRVDKYPKM